MLPRLGAPGPSRTPQFPHSSGPCRAGDRDSSGSTERPAALSRLVVPTAHALPFLSCLFKLRHSKSVLPLATTGGQEGDHLAFIFFLIELFPSNSHKHSV